MYYTMGLPWVGAELLLTVRELPVVASTWTLIAPGPAANGIKKFFNY